MSAILPGQLSPDGSYYWNGQQWVSTLSPDGAHRWNGSTWEPVAQTAAAALPTPAGPAAATPYGAPAALRRPSGLGYQFGGSAAWSIGFGLASLLAPFVAQTYFIVLPLFGLYRGFIAIRAGRTAGGAIGIALNVLGGIMSLLASGLIHP